MRLRQPRHDVELRQRFVQRLDGLLADADVGYERLRELDAGFLVPAGGGQDDVRLHGRAGHAELPRDDHLELLPEVLADDVRRGPAAKRVHAGEEQHLRLRPDGHPAVVERLLRVLGDGLRQRRIVERHVVDDLAIAGVVRVQVGHRGRAARHLRGHRLHDLLDVAHLRALAGRRRLPDHRELALVVVQRHVPPGADAQAAALLARVAGKRRDQDHRALEEIHVVVLAGAPRREDGRRVGVRVTARDLADGVGVDAGDRPAPSPACSPRAASAAAPTPGARSPPCRSRASPCTCLQARAAGRRARCSPSRGRACRALP